ncbi:hypothetical protein B0H63DRAFT_503719 [Podospora didyma]|uniref:protein disulfide-isomerase n=1 Tax=Podospora didyma TaxID=330526 RepID=A0AAE0KAS8_9PEZI|nr:hypothetical protein B0H63DRAFT_503719 [Podospora didyma]
MATCAFCRAPTSGEGACAGADRLQELEADWAVVVRDAAQDAQVSSIDCAVEAAVCIGMDVLAYPAIRLYHADGRVDRYRGPRKAAQILSFLPRASRPAVSEISPAALDSFLSLDDVVFTAEFLPSDASLYEGHYRRLASQYHDRFSFAVLPPSQQQQSVVRCRNNPNDENFTLKELWLVGALDELVTQCTTPLIRELGRKEIAELGQVAARAGKTMVVHYFATSDKEKDAYKTEMQSLAKKYSDELLFTIIDANEHPAMPEMAGLPAGMVTGISIENLRTGQVFPHAVKEDGISAVALEAFLGDVVNGAAKAWDGHRSGDGPVHNEL